MYSLRESDHSGRLTESLWGLLGKEELTDCTLVCSSTTPPDSPPSNNQPTLIPAHRLVLSANSPYFKSLFSSHSQHQNPILILHDVDVEVAKLLVAFMYRGQITVSSHLLPTLMKTAENLQITGLSKAIKNVVSTNHQQQHYSKKARILESGLNLTNRMSGDMSNDYSGGMNRMRRGEKDEGDGGDEEPLSLRKESSSISAPSTPLAPPHHTHSHHILNNSMETDEESDDDRKLSPSRLIEKRRGRSMSGTSSHPNNTPYSSSSQVPHSYPPSPEQSSSSQNSQCPHCPDSNFPTHSLLNHHLLTEHPTHHPHHHNHSSNQILCKFCSKPFPEVSSLIQHLPVHTGDRPFKCEFCGKAFKLRHHMKDHARMHTGERPFRCGLCGKTFSRSTILKAHEKTHFGAENRGGRGGSGGGDTRGGKEDGV